MKKNPLSFLITACTILYMTQYEKSLSVLKNFPTQSTSTRETPLKRHIEDKIKPKKMFKIIGAGKFGTALQKCISEAGGSFSENSYEWLIPAVPSTAVKEVIQKELDNKKSFNVLLVSKGMFQEKFLSELLKEMGISYAVLAGPHFAAEIESDLPTRSTIASQNADHFDQLKGYFPNPNFLNNPDLVCLASVFKNIAAFACGMSDGLELGNNARACIIQEAIIQLPKLASLFGFFQTSSVSDLLQPGILGDLILTCTSDNSRNFLAGKALIRSEKTNFLVESAHSAKILLERIKVANAQNHLTKEQDKELAFSLVEIVSESNLKNINNIKKMIISLIKK